MKVIGQRPFENTPWYLRILGFKKYRRLEVRPALILFDADKWIYYDEIEE